MYGPHTNNKHRSSVQTGDCVGMRIVSEPHRGDSGFEVCDSRPEPQGLTVADLQSCCSI